MTGSEQPRSERGQAMATLRELRENEVHVGQDLGAEEYAVTPELVRWYVDAVEDDHAWYHGASPFGGPVAPALLFHNPNYMNGRRNLWYLPNIYGNLHAKQHWDLFAPMLVGESVQNRGVVVDRYLKRDREYVVAEGTLSDLTGRPLARVRSTQSFLPDSMRSGTVVEQSRPVAQGKRPEAEAVGDNQQIAGRRHLVDAGQCDRFVGEVRNYHNDAAESKKLGFPGIVVVGSLSTCFVSDMMTHEFGEGWWCGGRMDLNFINVLWAGEAVTARGAVRERTREGSLWRTHLDVWTEKDDGTKTTAGTASALTI
jgi:acyl dehydratase